MGVYDAQREELVHLAGDPEQGVSSTVNLTKTAKGHPLVRYKDVVLTLDVYELAGEPMTIHLICPRCRNALRITADRKAMEYDPKKGDATAGGRIDVEAFECTWEMPEGRRQDFGIGLCRWRVVIDNNIARDV